MALGKLMMYALKLLSYNEGDIKKNYQIDRKVRNILNAPVLSNYNMWDHKINADGYDIPVRVFLPEEQRSSEIIIYFHGGGWVVGNIENYSRVCATLSSATGRRVLSVDYRLAPEHKFPAAPEDCYTAVREIYLNAEFIDSKPESIILAGDSAGGNLAAAVSLMAADRNEFKIFRQILIYPSTGSDHSASSPYKSIHENGTDYLLTSKRVCDYISLYLKNEEDYLNPYYAPVLAPNLCGQPKTLVITAEYDPLRDEGELYADMLAAAGCEVTCRRIPDSLHGFFALPKTFDAVREAYIYINNFLSEKYMSK